MVLKIWTDGSYKDGYGAWCFLCENGISYSGSAKASNSYMMELLAIINALKYAPNNSNLSIYTDSRSAIDAISGNSKVRKHKELVRQAINLINAKKLKVSFQWVKGHSGSANNAFCDKVCKLLVNQALELKAAKKEAKKQAKKKKAKK